MSRDSLSLESVSTRGLFFQGGNSPVNFLQDCLRNSISYHRAAGYFSSSVYLAAQESLVTFIENGGIIKLVCSPRMMPEDLQAIEQGQQARLVMENSLERDLNELLNMDETRSATKLLGKLVEMGNLEIKIATRENFGRGIFHSKVGVFEDVNGGKIGFIGSTNETWSGWSDYGNSESFIAKSTYVGHESIQDVNDMETYFNALWTGILPELVVRDLPSVPREILARESTPHKLEELIDDVQKVRARRALKTSEKTTFLKKLMPHQKLVLQDWKKKGYVGIIDHVTGAGKTITAINAVRDWISDGRPALIIVPSQILQKQWAEEISSEIGIQPLLVGGVLGGKDKWLHFLSDNTRASKDFGPRITLATVASASSESFTTRLQVSESLLVIADEVHTLGQSQCINLMNKIESKVGATLGLSATYERFGDPEGTSRIERTFGKTLEPKFQIADAIAAGRLVPYDYHFGTVNLTPEEEERYEDLSEKIRTSIAREKGQSFSSFSGYLQNLIFSRAAILKGASGKTNFAIDIFRDNYRRGQNWLVYCDDTSQLNEVSEALRTIDIQNDVYYDAMPGSKSETLMNFKINGGVLIAIKCLDEGVDIPSATHALILASSQNPREYIQRRGRVLRSNITSGKSHATIFDVVVTSSENVPLNKQEIERMLAFAGDADNSTIQIDIQEMISRMQLIESVFIQDSFEEAIDTAKGEQSND
jgi:superfamily II DNA or RNA helicase